MTGGFFLGACVQPREALRTTSTRASSLELDEYPSDLDFDLDNASRLLVGLFSAIAGVWPGLIGIRRGLLLGGIQHVYSVSIRLYHFACAAVLDRCLGSVGEEAVVGLIMRDGPHRLSIWTVLFPAPCSNYI
jgi:hypothetical protein